VGRGEVVAGRGSELAHGLVQRGGECELGLPESYGDDVVGDGDVVPGQLDDVFDALTEDDDQDGGRPVARGELVGVDHTLDGRVLFGLGQLVVTDRCRCWGLTCRNEIYAVRRE
jgi:hypothetical protein